MSTRSAPGRARPAPRRPAPGPAPRRRPARPFVLGDVHRRGGVLLLVTAVTLSLFAVRLVDLQAVRGEALASKALGQRLETTAITAQRGSILDSSGQPLALTVEARNVTADQTLIDDPAAVAAALGPILGAAPEVLAERLTGERRFVYVAKGITPETWSRISTLRLPGIFSEAATRRVYPAGDLGANVVGFVGGEQGEGLGGIEYALNDQLAGTDGTQTTEYGPGGRIIPTGANSTTDATAGTTVQLTIDRDIQFVAQRTLARQVKAAQADSGTLVVLDPRSGQILALATSPTFDANKAASAPDSARSNSALTHVFEPGSTAKLMTLAAVVNEGKANPYSVFRVPGGLSRGGKVFHDDHAHGTEMLTLAGIMAKSSNIGTILASERIGGRKLLKYLKRFGVGQPTGLRFPGEANGYVPPHADWSATSFPTIAFGQGLSVNAVQTAAIFGAIANDGVRVQPSLVAQTTSADGTVTAAPEPTRTRVVSASTARQVRAMLEAVVTDGTAPMAAIPGYRVGGKTGTAQEYNASCRCYSGVVASFIGMAPLDDPRLVVAVSIFNPKVGRYGGVLGGPVFKRVMTYALQKRGIPPTGTKPGHLPISAG